MLAMRRGFIPSYISLVLGAVVKENIERRHQSRMCDLISGDSAWVSFFRKERRGYSLHTRGCSSRWLPPAGLRDVLGQRLRTTTWPTFGPVAGGPLGCGGPGRLPRWSCPRAGPGHKWICIHSWWWRFFMEVLQADHLNEVNNESRTHSIRYCDCRSGMAP
jgi:hypothetical protein